ncbi:MAG: glycosyltransferase [Candidatus Woesearchaeota archaeon]
MDITLLILLQYTVYFISLYFSVFWLLVYLEGEEKQPTNKRRTYPQVTIAIPAYNEEKTIAKTIESALNINYPKNKLEILVINDGSTDKTRNIANNYTHHEHVHVLNQKNKGKGAALNRAVRKAKGEYFVCLDADSEVHPETLKELIKHFSTEEVAVVIPVMKIKNNKKLNLLEKLQWYEYLVNVFFKKIMGQLDAVHVAPGPFSVYNKSLIQKNGYFDETNITEDLEMTVRLQQNNYRIIQSLEGEVYTNAMPNMKRYLAQRNRWFKGGVLTAIQYRHMLFNKKWGDFGMMQLPILILSGVISLLLVGTLLYELLKPILKNALQLGLVRFDILTYLQTITIDIAFVDLSAASIVLLAVMFTLSITILRLATYYAKERTLTYNPLIVSTYLIFYFFLLAATWAVVTKDLLLGKVQKW